VRAISSVAGRRITRVPWTAVERVSGRVYLSVTGETLGLRKTEDRLQGLFKRIPLS
jgi:hypothetical protein